MNSRNSNWTHSGITDLCLERLLEYIAASVIKNFTLLSF